MGQPGPCWELDLLSDPLFYFGGREGAKPSVPSGHQNTDSEGIMTMASNLCSGRPKRQSKSSAASFSFLQRKLSKVGNGP